MKNIEDEKLLHIFFDFLVFIKSLEKSVKDPDERDMINQDYEVIKNYALLYLSSVLEEQDIEKAFEELYTYYIKKNMS